MPLKYHYPVGLLHDLFSGNAAADADDDDQVGAEAGKPWRLVVSYSEFPADMLMGLDAEGRVVKDCYVNAVKEVRFCDPSFILTRFDDGRMSVGRWTWMLIDAKQADVIRNGKGNVYMGLSKDDSDTLWQAVQDRKFFISLLFYFPPSSAPFHSFYLSFSPLLSKRIPY